MNKLIWYSEDSVEVYPNFYPRKDSLYAPKRNGVIETNRIFKLTDTDFDKGTYWVEDIYGDGFDEPDDYVDVEIVELEIKEKNKNE